VGGNPWERRSQALHFCNLECPDLKSFCLGNAHSQAGDVNATVHGNATDESDFDHDNGPTRIQGAAAKLKGACRFLHGPRDFYRFFYLKITL